MTYAARILVVTDRGDHAQTIVQQLQGEFAPLKASADPGRAWQQFKAFMPDVLVLAFDRLAKAQSYLAALRGSDLLPSPAEYRSVILCSVDECEVVADLCRQGHFDDYVLFWPHAYDGFRLAMSLRIACREVAAARLHRSRPVDLLKQARHVDALDRILEEELSGVGEQVMQIKQSLASNEREIESTVDGFARRLRDPAAVEWIDVKDADVLAREIAELKERHIEAARRCRADDIDSVHARTKTLKDRLEPSLAGARALVDELRKQRPVVMIVEDDEFARELVGRALDPQYWDAVFAKDSDEAVNQLRRMRPDVILMDIRLPGVDGVSLTRQLKAAPHFADIPVVMMTGDARRETLLSSLAAGADAFIVKPFTRDVVTAKLEKVLAR